MISQRQPALSCLFSLISTVTTWWQYRSTQ